LNILADAEEVAEPGIFIKCSPPSGLRDGSPSDVQDESPVIGARNEVPQKLKQFADIVYRFLLQKRSKLKSTFWGLSPQAHASAAAV